MDERIEETKVGIPESVTLGGIVYTVKDNPELQQFIQAVAKVEKTKLYSQFENLKSQIANLGRVRVTGEQTQTDINAIVEKMKDIFVTKEDFKTTLPEVLRDVVSPVLTATEQNRQESLLQYREKIIQENIDKCIPDLVKGETKEELDASLQESIRIRASYPSPSSVSSQGAHVKDPLITHQEREQPTQTPTTPPTPVTERPAVPTPPPAPRRPSPEAGGPVNIRQMSMEEFAKQREALQAQLSAIYQN